MAGVDQLLEEVPRLLAAYGLTTPALSPNSELQMGHLFGWL